MADNADQQEFITRLGDVKDAMGEWHDRQERTAIAGDILDHGPRCQLLRELQRISEVKYQRALADALRKIFAGPVRKLAAPAALDILHLPNPSGRPGPR